MAELSFSGAVRLYKQHRFSQFSKATQKVYAAALSNWEIVLGDKKCTDLSLKQLNKLKERTEIQDRSKNIGKYFYRHIQILLLLVTYLEEQTIASSLDSDSLKKYMRQIRHNSKIDINSKFEGNYVSKNEFQRLIKYWESNDEFQTAMLIRNRLIISLLYDVGIKTNELTNLMVTDYDPINNIISVGSNKNKKVLRKIRITESTAKLLHKYLSYRRGIAGKNGIYSDHAPELIVTYTSDEQDIMHSHPITDRSVQRILSQTVDDTGIAKDKITPKNLRATAIVNDLIDENITLEDLNHKFGFRGITGYQQYLPLARSLKGITKNHITLPKFSKTHGIPEHYAYQLCKSGKLPCIYFRFRYYIDPNELGDDLLFRVTSRTV